tara:strand:- start:7893 stop:8282 length:390 start_codon:yes stop_codon:yes gene_type:complete
MELNERQKTFCKEFIIDFNATRAAIKAGYKEKTARSIGSENLTKPNIQEYIAELTQARNKRVEVTADRVVQELAKFAFAEDEAVDGFTIDPKDKTKCLELLARHTGAFNADDSGKNIINVTMGDDKKKK